MVAGKALVTGATGGLGRILTAMLLAQGREAIATGRDAASGAMLAKAGARFVGADLVHDDPAPLLAGVDSVFHLAALSSPWGRRADFVAINCTATQRLLAAARAAGCKRLIFASTPSVYTASCDRLGLSEASTLPKPPVNDYAATKLQAERAVLDASAADFHTAAVRPRAIVGPYDTVLLPRLLHAAERGFLPLPGFGRALIEPTDARDVAAALIAAEARSGAANGMVFNVSGGVPVRLGEFARYVFGKLDRQVRLIPLPARLVLGLAGLAEIAARLRPGQPEPGLTRYSAKALGWSQTFDLTRAKTILGWQPCYTPHQAVDWALEQRGDA
jgi:2-alkyl-3-oxoalkanoate reductase